MICLKFRMLHHLKIRSDHIDQSWLYEKLSRKQDQQKMIIVRYGGDINPDERHRLYSDFSFKSENHIWKLKNAHTPKCQKPHIQLSNECKMYYLQEVTSFLGTLLFTKLHGNIIKCTWTVNDDKQFDSGMLCYILVLN